MPAFPVDAVVFLEKKSDLPKVWSVLEAQDDYRSVWNPTFKVLWGLFLTVNILAVPIIWWYWKHKHLKYKHYIKKGGPCDHHFQKINQSRKGAARSQINGTAGNNDAMYPTLYEYDELSMDSLVSAAIQRQKAPSTVHLNDPTVFELDGYASQYTGRRKIQRLLFVARSCPELALDAYTSALREIESTLDVGLYETTLHEYKTTLEGFEREIASSSTPSAAALASVDKPLFSPDMAWIKQTRDKAEKEQDKLEVELKSYQSNVIKESIRMGHRDLANFHHRTGDLQNAIRLHTKTRDYCGMPSHIIDMCLAVIDVALEMGNYSIVKSYVVKAEAALESSAGSAAAAQAKSKGVNLPGMVQPTLTKKEEALERSRIVLHERLAVVSGVAELGQGNYERAAYYLLKVTAGARQEDAQHFIAPADIALYAVFCGLATMNRNQLKRRLIENVDLRPLLELTPWLKNLLSAFYDSRYQQLLSLLSKHHARLALDLHLSFQLSRILPMIEAKAVIQYFAPFTSVSLGKMASAFGWTEDEMLKHIISLVEKGDLAARIDSKNKVIKAYKPSDRTALFKEALEIGEQAENASRALMMRIKLIQADLIVKEKPVRGQTNGSNAESEE